jgi:hypothetical protein
MNLQDINQIPVPAWRRVLLGMGQTRDVSSRVAANTVGFQNFFLHLAIAGRRSNHGQPTTAQKKMH